VGTQQTREECQQNIGDSKLHKHTSGAGELAVTLRKPSRFANWPRWTVPRAKLLQIR
jgi:hypothetical protein